MLEIGHLRLHLPSGMRRRAPRIARLLGDALASSVPSNGGQIDSLTLHPVRIRRGDSDRAVAGRIAAAIVTRVESRTR